MVFLPKPLSARYFSKHSASPCSLDFALLSIPPPLLSGCISEWFLSIYDPGTGLCFLSACHLAKDVWQWSAAKYAGQKIFVSAFRCWFYFSGAASGGTCPVCSILCHPDQVIKPGLIHRRLLIALRLISGFFG